MGAADCYALAVGVAKPFNRALRMCVGFRTAVFSSGGADLPVSWFLLFLNNTSHFQTDLKKKYFYLPSGFNLPNGCIS